MASRFDLDPEAWRTLRELLDAALQLDPGARPEWLRALGPEHARFRERLESLLAHADGAAPGGRFDTLPHVAAQDFAASTDQAGGHEIGPYRLVIPLGEGGMGTVWLAERRDMLVRRPVALKLPRIAGGAGLLAERMAREREILAALDHNNIARLYDAGVTADGQPYLALEYVHGERIDLYCNQRGLDAKSRVRLLLQVASAVAHAHSRLVVHRDLKPGNILVNEEGQVRLLDFGIARLLDDPTGQAGDLTQQAGRAFTPAYAAPEQILGEPFSTASDVYSLGVVAYELLSGQLPYGRERKSAALLEEAILRGDPKRLSSEIQSRDRRVVRGDLDSIILKALRRLPAERYGTAQALADDLQRWLDGRPVLAQPDSVGYRASRFVRRNKLAVATTAAVAGAILVGTGAALWQAQVARGEQRRAEEVKEFVASVFRDADPFSGEGEALTARDLLVQAIARIDAHTELAPALRIELVNLIVASLSNLQDYDTAEPLAERNIADASSALPVDHPQTLLARLQRADIHRFRGRQADLQAELDAIWPAVSRVKDTNPELALHANRALLHLWVDQGRFAEAVGLSKTVHEETARLYGSEHPLVATSLLERGLALHFDRQHRAALPYMESALALLTGTLGRSDTHPQVIDSRIMLGMALNKVGRLQEGTAVMERALEDAIARFGPRSTNVGFYHGNVAFDQTLLGNLDAALQNADRAIEILGAGLDQDSTSFAAAVHNRAVIHLERRDLARAVMDARTATETFDRTLGESHDRSARARLVWMAAAGRSGETDQALFQLEPLVQRLNDEGSTALPSALHVLGLLYRLAGRPGDALQAQRLALGKLAAADEPLRLPILGESGLALVDLGRSDEAVEMFAEAEARYRDRQLWSTPAMADTWTGHGRALLVRGDSKAACERFSLALQARRSFHPEGPESREVERLLKTCPDRT